MQLIMNPQKVVTQYNLDNIVDPNGWVYINICKCMYGLNQAGVIAKQELQNHLNKYRFHPVTFTPNLWNHEDKDTVFFLVVDDFAIKFTSDENENYLIQSLKINMK